MDKAERLSPLIITSTTIKIRAALKKFSIEILEQFFLMNYRYGVLRLFLFPVV
ncbi:protein of unknown function [Legionella longbeachae NSW150]|uniref:Uncharacterized protein n=1 Tax=Legionella longbeachae serogroup 1 (strain NSW150) TaxID=661367 RepID=D3HJS6_LEGLN|nr:protein of unknown function [Legionella longbeachae NSW150]